MDIGVQISLQNNNFISFNIYPEVGSYDSSIFNFLSNLHTVFHTGCAIYIPTKQCTRFPFSPHPQQHSLYLGFLVTSMYKSEMVSHGFDLHLLDDL